jgi:large subunit ribosomal protein L30
MTAQAEPGDQIKVTQTGSPIGRHKRQRANLIGLGLNKSGRSKVWADTPEVRGRINRVHHLVKVESTKG